MWRLRRFSSGAGDGRRIAGAFGVVVKEEVDSGGTCRRVVFEFLRVKVRQCFLLVKGCESYGAKLKVRNFLV